MSRVKTYKRIAAIQRLQQTLAEAELLSARENVAEVDRALAACTEESSAIWEAAVSSMVSGDSEQWSSSLLAREQMSRHWERLHHEMTSRRIAESESVNVYNDARLRCEQTSTLLDAERARQRTADESRSQKAADELALRRFCVRG